MLDQAWSPDLKIRWMYRTCLLSFDWSRGVQRRVFLHKSLHVSLSLVPKPCQTQRGQRARNKKPGKFVRTSGWIADLFIMSFDHSCPAEWPISKRKNTVFLAFFGAVAAQKSWLNVFTIVMTTKDTWMTLSLSPIANGSGCCKFPDQKTSQQQRRFPSTSCRLATYIVVFYRLLDIHNSYICDL